MNKTEITNQEESLKSGPTGGGFIDKKKDSTESVPDTTSEIIGDDENQENSNQNYSAKPVDIAKQQYYESQKKLNDSKAKCWDRFKTIMTVAGVFIGLIITFLGIFWAYKISNIAEPIGGLKNEMKNIKDQNNELKDRMQRSEDKIDDLIKNVYSQ